MNDSSTATPRIYARFMGKTFTPGAGAPAEPGPVPASTGEPAPRAETASSGVPAGSGGPAFRVEECCECGERHAPRADGLCPCQGCGRGVGPLGLLDGLCCECDPEGQGAPPAAEVRS